MAKKHLVSKKEQKLREEYQSYLDKKQTSRPQGTTRKASLKTAKTYYQWKQEKAQGSEKAPKYGAIAAIKKRREEERKSYEKATGRKAKKR